MAKDYYKILGVDKNATKEQIKKAYKRLAKKYHPDLNKDDGAAEKFKEISEAASVLGDDNKRQQYNQFGDADAFKRASAGAGGFSGFDFSDFMSSTSGFGDFGDIFDQFFGGGRRGRSRRRGPSRGSDLRFDLEISLEEAAFGAKKHIIIPRLETCTKCDGSGAESKSDIKTCPECHGSGMIQRIISTTTTCGKCRGEGKVIKNPCNVCDGEGRIEKKRKLEINIPAGVENGTRLRVSGEGEVGERGAGPGDLYVVLHAKEHDLFERQGNDLYIDVPITFAQAALGDEIEVPTLKGKSKMKIPSGTQTGTTFRMKGKGVQSLQGYGTGSQMVRVIIQTPKKLNKKQKELLKEFEKQNKDKKPYKKLFEKVKGVFS